MSKESWSLIKNSKRFYVRAFRWTASLVVLSVFINLLLGMAVYYLYFNQPENDFYVTDGVTPPALLTPMDEANETNVPLLADDPATDDETRAIPQ